MVLYLLDSSNIDCSSLMVIIIMNHHPSPLLGLLWDARYSTLDINKCKRGDLMCSSQRETGRERGRENERD